MTLCMCSVARATPSAELARHPRSSHYFRAHIAQATHVHVFADHLLACAPPQWLCRLLRKHESHITPQHGRLCRRAPALTRPLVPTLITLQVILSKQRSRTRHLLLAAQLFSPSLILILKCAPTTNLRACYTRAHLGQRTSGACQSSSDTRDCRDRASEHTASRRRCRSDRKL